MLRHLAQPLERPGDRIKATAEAPLPVAAIGAGSVEAGLVTQLQQILQGNHRPIGLARQG